MTKATTTKATATSIIAVESFDHHARKVLGALKEFDAASAKASRNISMAYQVYLDTQVDLPKDQASVTALGKAMREAPAFRDAIGLGLIERKTVTEYAQSAMRAFYWGVEFAPSLKNDPSMALPWTASAKSGTAEKAGPVKSTTREALDATLCKALAQARLLGLTEFAACVLDVCLERLDGFKEPEAAKL